jgi:hypothetical protein
MPKILNQHPSRTHRGKIVKSKGAAKNDEFQVLDLRKRIASLYLEGKAQHEIAAELDCTQPNISYHLIKIREEWLGSVVRDFDSAKAKELAKIDHLEETCWIAFYKSAEDSITKTREREKVRIPVPTGEDGETEEQMKVVKENYRRIAKGQAGDPRFLERISWCIEKRCKILGLIDEEKGKTSAMVILNFDQLVSQTPPEKEENLDVSDDPVERRILVEAQPPSSPQKKVKK